MAFVPVVRSPPFPGVRPHVAAVSCAMAVANVAGDPTELATAIRAARVGGSFWAQAPSITAGTTLVRIATPEAAATLAHRAIAPMLALLPDEGWSREAMVDLRRTGIQVHVGEVDLWPLLDQAAAVEAPGDDEALLLARIADIPIRPTTQGRFADGAASPEELVEAAILRGIAYRDPFSNAAVTPLAVIERLAEWRLLIESNRGVAVAAGIAMWKRREVSQLLWNGTTPLRFARSTGRALRLAREEGGAIIAWPSRVPAGLPDAARAVDVPLRRVEDGFIRSVGLGSNLHPPLSIVADAGGIYFDPASRSDLETLLAEHAFPPDLLARARRLAETIVRAGISKYSSGADTYRLDAPADSRVVLVCGQVEDDLSVRLGGGGVAGNLDLLRRSRAAEPDAFLLFKPHPDVDAGHRAGRIDDADALRLADRVVRDVPMPALLDAVNGVHVLTSLAGYEALLRGRDVTVHGSPFYAGWGLTRDLGPPLPRRTRRLTLDQLTAAALILYPRYLDPVTGLPCPPEILVERLAGQRMPRQTALIRARRLQGWLRRAHVPIGRPE